MMTVFPAKEVVGIGSLPKSWPYMNLAKNAGDASPGMLMNLDMEDCEDDEGG